MRRSGRRSALCARLLVWALAVGGCGFRGAQDAPLVVAHRVGADYFPENSRRALQGSIERGFAAVEVDLLLTRDGVPVIWHDVWLDGTLCRRADGTEFAEGERHLISELDWADLRDGFECGGKPHPNGRHPDAELVWDRLATFEDMLETVGAAPQMTLHLDVKYEPGFTAPPEDFARIILGQYRAAGLPNPAYASATTPELLRAFRAELPELELTLIWPRFTQKIDGRSDVGVAVGTELGRVTGIRSLAAQILEAHADGVAMAWQVSDRHEVEKLRQEGFKVQVWTVNDPAQLAAWCSWPIDALITDAPEAAPCH